MRYIIHVITHANCPLYVHKTASTKHSTPARHPYHTQSYTTRYSKLQATFHLNQPLKMSPWFDREISPPRNAAEHPRPGYYPHDYRGVSPLRRPSLGRRISSTPQMHANLAGADGSDMPGGDWYDREEGMPTWRRGRENVYRRGFLSEDWRWEHW